MDYQELFQKENRLIMERYDLAMGRIAQMRQELSGADSDAAVPEAKLSAADSDAVVPAEETRAADPDAAPVAQPFGGYFLAMAQFVCQIEELTRCRMRDELEALSLEALQKWNYDLYSDILPEHYEQSYANPAFAAAQLGKELGALLSAFYAQLRGAIVFAYECRLTDITILCETLIELYNMFEEQVPSAKQVRDVLYWFHSDYTDVTLAYRIRETLDPSLSFAADIIMESDLSDLRYLYRFGEYISDTELRVAEFLNGLPEETIEKMASTYTEGYRKGFEVMGVDLSCKSTVCIRYELGFERMIRAAIRQFEAMGLKPILYRAATWSVTKNPNRRVGYYGTPANRQYDYDHRYDQAIYLDKAFKERKLAVLRTAYEACRKLAAQYAGPAVVETFGEDGFKPVNKPECFSLTPKQEELSIAYSNEAMPITNQYIPANETSFTIIAFPVPAIGPDFAEIFAETIRINTLDYEVYKKLQQNIIQVLDQASSVHVTGRNGNRTDIRISLHPLSDVTKETNFENCVADVNIPVGEVFTSPVLKGTTGLLQVSQVYLLDYQYRNLQIRFEDGMVTEYSCDNFDNPEEGKALIRQEILKNHDTLPMGEFAIGTNTAAYAMAQKYGIADKLPILIAEKMGPHFAVGDTCYSWSEDSPVYNPDGREVIARDNECSIKRKEDVSKAYFGCHLDITIPYSELGDITAICPDGRELPVIRDGRFAVPGTERLNEELPDHCLAEGDLAALSDKNL